ncbi:hypothetical protein [Streptomyces sp. NPDC055056]
MRSLTRASIDAEGFSAFAAAFAEGNAPEQWALDTSSLFSPISDPDRVLARPSHPLAVMTAVAARVMWHCLVVEPRWRSAEDQRTGGLVHSTPVS